MENTSREANHALDEYAQEPVATGLMTSGVFDQASFDASHGSAATGLNNDYAFRFAYSLASQAVSTMRGAGGDSVAPCDHPILAQTVRRLGTGVVNLDEEILVFAMDYFKAGLLQAFPSWAGKAPRLPAGASLPPSPPALGLEAKQAMGRAISGIDAIGPMGRGKLLDALSDQPSVGSVPAMLTRARVLAQRARIAAESVLGKPGPEAPRV